MKRWSTIACIVSLALLAGLSRWQSPARTDSPAAVHIVSAPLQTALKVQPWQILPKTDYVRDIQPILATHCVSCHDSATASGGIVFDAANAVQARKQKALWKRVAGQLHRGMMPPADRPRPSEQELATLTSWAQTVIAEDPGEPNRKQIGRVTVRRLNRAEYNRTMRDLLGVDLRPADAFPADDLGYGFDNNGDVLSTPPLLIEKYLATATRVVDAALAAPQLRERLLNPPPEDPALIPFRGLQEPVREEARKSFRKAPQAAPPPPDQRTVELNRAYDCLRSFADRAWRRPAKQEELIRLLHFVEAAQNSDAGWQQGLASAFKAILVSPFFLFRFELDDGAAGAGRSRSLNDFELAARLSYFLWSSMPDEELKHLAARNNLHKANILSAQVARMLGDSKADALSEEFAPQWLQIRGLQDAHPDPQRFPSFDEALRSAMTRETILFFQGIVREDRSVLEFLDADYTFVNERLANHYGIPDVHGDHFRRVSLSGMTRGGILTQASVLTITSNPTRTSPVKRGKWILENLLGAPPPPAPPNVPDLKDDVSPLSGNLRTRMEQHRRNSTCASCHARMDPLGFGLENFDAVGAWRTHDGPHLIDASGVLPGGRNFRGPEELRAVLHNCSSEFARCLTEKMFTYALGRGVEASDYPTIDAIVSQLRESDYRFSALVQAIVQSEAFRMRIVEKGEP